MKLIVAVILCLSIIPSHAQMDTVSRVDEGLLYTIVNIQKGKYSGTGFITGRKNPTAYQFFLVTNKHMIGDFNYVDPFIMDSLIKVTFYTDDTNHHVSVSIPLKDKFNNTLPTVKVHPLPSVDIAVIDITQDIKHISNWKVASVDTSFLLEAKNIQDGARLGLGSQVFAIGYPAGLKLESTNEPIVKAGYIASTLTGNLRIKLTVENRKKQIVNIIPDGKYFLIDGLIVGGNSGGPIVNPQELQTKFENGQFYYRKTQNLFIGIVSGGFNNTGITIAYSSDNIKEVINKFPSK